MKIRLNLTLKKLSLANFKGLASFAFAPSSTSSIRGANGTGKTSVYDAWLWLLFGKNSKDSASFDVIRNGQNEASVSALVSVDGSDVEFSRTIRNVFTKKRGQAESELTGTETVYSIDGVPCLKKDYDARISAIVDQDVFKLLSNPRSFNSLKWENRRQILMSAFGDVDENEILEHDFAGLLENLNGKSVADFKKIQSEARKRLNDSLKLIPARIDEAQRIANEKPENLQDP